MSRGPQALLILSTLLVSWLGMQVVHEAGHVLGAWGSGGSVVRVVLHPLAISRTDVEPNPRPLIVVWCGPLVGVVLPVCTWLILRALRTRGEFVARFFAGFCLVANGAYIAIGSFKRIGDSGEMLRHDSPLWTLWLFGLVTVPEGFGLWHRQGAHFGSGSKCSEVDRTVAYRVAAMAITLVSLELLFGGR